MQKYGEPSNRAQGFGVNYRMAWQGFRYAFRGLAALVRTGHNFRVHLVAIAGVCGAGVGLKISPTEWAAVGFAAFAVLAAEAFNSSIEALLDHLHPERHPAVGRAKDVAAAAVFLTAIGAAIVGGMVFFPKLWALIR